MPSAVRVNNKWDRQHGRKVPFLHFDGSFTTKTHAQSRSNFGPK